MSAATRSRGAANQNGDALAAAMASEEGIAAEAAVIRGENVGIDAALFLKLAPLLRRSIPAGFIQTLGSMTGKPYDSTGIKSVQVQINRMDNVLTQLGWRDHVEYHDGGKVARVRVQVVTLDGTVLAEREAWGGVNQASTEGNRYKGTYTNAAKVAFARLGPGHEVYVGATDLDPDVHEQTAAQQVRKGAEPERPVDSPEVSSARDSALAMCKEVLDRGLLTKDAIKARLVAAGATDTTSSLVAIASLSDSGVQDFGNQMMDLIAGADGQS